MSVEERAPAGGVRGRLLDLMFVRGRVEEVTPGPGRMRWIAVAGVPGLDWTPGQQVRVHVADITSARTWVSGAVLQSLRTYSVWDYDASAGVMRLCVMDHEAGGPGTRWARDLRPGREVVFGKPEGRFGLRPADYHVFAGEETASVAFGAMLRAAQPDEPVHGVIEVAGAEDRLPLPRAGELTWRHRGDAPAADSAALVDAVRGLDLPSEPGIAYVAGEARTVQAVRAHLMRERGWPRRSVLVKPFWTPGKRGME
ncbi:siderophore-interacting protein [Actinomadura madurae]|uniref:siderophore-interacting protein n=1 Tax=Actinomadura madurae TaxID=1993 RepID=UPI0020D20717|nr:siderophore-interacting protein [Actinomadura madurae]MCP9955851.1 siderophore-interacting protein [Actinomadura madurae]MCP9972584.1 siderophore-interacting protein [Actinomadura madurae]MCQ0003342.1 siderophore-interacting protein [Actinomadura madurae]